MCSVGYSNFFREHFFFWKQTIYLVLTIECLMFRKQNVTLLVFWKKFPMNISIYFSKNLVIFWNLSKSIWHLNHWQMWLCISIGVVIFRFWKRRRKMLEVPFLFTTMYYSLEELPLCSVVSLHCILQCLSQSNTLSCFWGFTFHRFSYVVMIQDREIITWQSCRR